MSRVVYFLRRHDGLVKIGTTGKFHDRLHALEGSHGPLEIIRVINGDARRENSIHAALRSHHEYGEWFRDGSDVRAYIETLEDGAIVNASETDRQRAWREGEEKTVEEARILAARLLDLRRSRMPGNEVRCINALSDEYGFSPSFFTFLAKGRALTISAWGLRSLRAALIAEMEVAKSKLLADLDQHASEAEAEGARLRMVVNNLSGEGIQAKRAAR